MYTWSAIDSNTITIISIEIILWHITFNLRIENFDKGPL